MRRDLAERLAHDLFLCSAKLDHSIAAVERTAGQDFFQTYRTSVGQVMGILYIDVLRDVFRQYPDLEQDLMNRTEGVLKPSQPALQMVQESGELLVKIIADLQDKKGGEVAARVLDALESAVLSTQQIAAQLMTGA